MSDVIELPRRPVPRKGRVPLEVVRYPPGCRHLRVLVDERLSKVTCRDCKAELNPIWVLGMLAQEDDRLRSQWLMMRAEVRLLSTKTKAKCRHCGKFTRLDSGASYHTLLAVTEQLEGEDERVT